MSTETHPDAPDPTLTSRIWAMKPGDEMRILDRTRRRSIQAMVSAVKKKSRIKFKVERDFMTRQSPDGVLIWRRK